MKGLSKERVYILNPPDHIVCSQLFEDTLWP